MVVLGLWIAVLGYGVLYTGVRNFQGASCTFAGAFQGKCSPTAPAGTSASAGKGGPGATVAQRSRHSHDRQYSWVARQRVLSQRTGVP